MNLDYHLLNSCYPDRMICLNFSDTLPLPKGVRTVMQPKRVLESTTSAILREGYLVHGVSFPWTTDARNTVRESWCHPLCHPLHFFPFFFFFLKYVEMRVLDLLKSSSTVRGYI